MKKEQQIKVVEYVHTAEGVKPVEALAAVHLAQRAVPGEGRGLLPGGDGGQLIRRLRRQFPLKGKV